MNQIVVMTPEQLQELIRETVDKAVAAKVPSGNAPRKLLTGEQVEEEYGLLKRNLEVWRAEGTGPRYSKIGKRVFYERSVLDAFIAENSILTTGRAA